LAWFGLASRGLAWLGLALFGLAWLGLAWPKTGRFACTVIAPYWNSVLGFEAQSRDWS